MSTERFRGESGLILRPGMELTGQSCVAVGGDDAYATFMRLRVLEVLDAGTVALVETESSIRAILKVGVTGTRSADDECWREAFVSWLLMPTPLRVDTMNVLQVWADDPAKRATALLQGPVGATVRLADANDATRACLWTSMAATAVGMMHTCGIAHLDLKPENFVVSPEGRLMLIDLGSARATDRERAEQCGADWLLDDYTTTPGTRAPEEPGGTMPVGDHVAQRDVYKLGLFGAGLLFGDEPPARLRALAEGAAGARFVFTSNGRARRALGAVCADALADAPEARPPHGWSVFARLNEAKAPGHFEDVEIPDVLWRGLRTGRNLVAMGRRLLSDPAAPFATMRYLQEARASNGAVPTVADAVVATIIALQAREYGDPWAGEATALAISCQEQRVPELASTHDAIAEALSRALSPERGIATITATSTFELTPYFEAAPQWDGLLRGVGADTFVERAFEALEGRNAPWLRVTDFAAAMQMTTVYLAALDSGDPTIARGLQSGLADLLNYPRLLGLYLGARPWGRLLQLLEAAIPIGRGMGDRTWRAAFVCAAIRARDLSPSALKEWRAAAEGVQT